MVAIREKSSSCGFQEQSNLSSSAYVATSSLSALEVRAFEDRSFGALSLAFAMMHGASLLSANAKEVACVYGLGAGACCVPSSRQLVTARMPSLSLGAAFGSSLCRRGVAERGPSCRGVRRKGVEAQIEMFSSEDFDVERLLGSQGYINVSSYTPPAPGGMFGTTLGENAPLGMDQRDISRIGGQEVGEGSVQTRLYAGRMGRGERMGTRVILKAYPAMVTSGSDADVMAANELAAHVALQDAEIGEISDNIFFLYGGFQTRTGEQWLVFRDDGKVTAADYAKMAADATTEGRAVGEWDFWDRFDNRRPIQRRFVFITKLLRGAFQGLAFMHSRGRLHQSLGPASIVLNTTSERDVMYLNPRLRDLAFSTDVSGQSELGGPTLEELWERRGSIVGSGTRDSAIDPAVAKLSEGLWRRAAMAGARDSLSRRSFGIADDIYAGGLLLAYMVFVPLCEAGSIDGPSLQRLLETTFRLDIPAVRDYCEADERWNEAVKFLNLDDGAGWQLLQAMLNPDYRSRPTVDAILSHRFLTGAVLSGLE